jgi:hypothetical protein
VLQDHKLLGRGVGFDFISLPERINIMKLGKLMLLVCPLFTLVCCLGAEGQDVDRQKTEVIAKPDTDRPVVAAIKRLGGVVKLDLDHPDQPVIEVYLSDGYFTSTPTPTDADLAILKGLTQLQSLSLDTWSGSMPCWRICNANADKSDAYARRLCGDGSRSQTHGRMAAPAPWCSSLVTDKALVRNAATFSSVVKLRPAVMERSSLVFSEIMLEPMCGA